MLKLLTILAAMLTIVSSSTSLIRVPNVQAQMTTCTAITSSVIADKIANGHSWGKHRNEFGVGRAIAGLAMPSSPRVTTVSEFKVLIQSVMGSAINKVLSAGRKAYWGSPTGTIEERS
jgi:hypothetical protein